jgi:thiol-disulfide isomerase/thioredoxin
VTKPLLSACILFAGLLLGAFHYKLKPAPTDRELRAYSRSYTGGAEWKDQIAPDFEFKTTTGDTFKLSDHVGKKIIVLNFFATWCGPCRAEMPELNRYFNEHKNEDFLLLAIDSEEQTDRVTDFLKDLKLDFPAGIDDGPIQKQYGVEAFPTTVLIGLDGKVQFYESGALANADVAFDSLLRQNRALLQAGKAISTADYLLLAQKQTALPVHNFNAEETQPEKSTLDPRATRIVARMDCPCGCDKKVKICTCHTSSNIKNALASEDFKNTPDDEIMKSLNKRFCMGAM